MDRIIAVCVAFIVVSGSLAADQSSINEATEQALKAAAIKVAPSVVQIETTGGAEMIGAGARGPGFRKGVGPTTGVIVGNDGLIISSAFNFAQKPASIFATVPGRRERFIARVVATDHTRMLTLLKVDATGLTTPEVTPKNEIRIGQWAVALGRALDANLDHPPSMSVGVVSALGRIWGKAIQTDAKISPANYGGPLVDLDGRVLGILVPAAPRGEGETAGVEWYDSGIGFAIPFDDVLKAVPRLKEGKDLRRGMLGITPKTSDQYGVPSTIGLVAPDSAAAKAGLRKGDIILAVDGQTIANQSQLQHALGPRYEGDTIALRIRREKDEIALDKVVLEGAAQAFLNPYLGVVPVRDDPELGVEVRWVEPKSPADVAGVKPGDRIMKIAPADAKELRPFSGRDDLRGLLNGLVVGSEVKVEVKRKADEKVETLIMKLAAMSDIVADVLPARATLAKALEPRKQVPIPGPPRLPAQPKSDDKSAPKSEEKAKPKPEERKVETGYLERSTPAKDHSYWLYVPANYDPNVSHALVVWLHAAGQGGKDGKDMTSIWGEACEQHHIILVGPKSESESGWLASEAEFVQEAAREVMKEYTIDRERVVAHGMAVGGQLAMYLGFQARDLIRGVATTGSVLATQPKDNLAGQRLAFFVVAGAKDPIAKDVAEIKAKLTEKKFPVIHREVADMGKEYLDRRTFDELVRWIDSLDRL
jgi:S1-C subfamily serine protease/predicted esterase